MARVRNNHAGFTIIELTLAITFLGSLMIFMTLATIQAIGIYNKGVAIKQINQAGRALVEDISRLSSSGFQITVDDNGKAGYLCVNFANTTRAVVWNSLKQGHGGSISNGGQFKLNEQPIGLARSNDGINGADGGYCGLPPLSDMILDPKDFTSMLTPQVRVLSVDIAKRPADGLSKLTFWIGTSDGGNGLLIPGMEPIQNSDKSWSCKGGSIGDFCAVSKFETILYTPNPNTEGEE